MSPRDRAEAFAAALRAEGVEGLDHPVGDELEISNHAGRIATVKFWKGGGVSITLYIAGEPADVPKIARWLKTGVWE